MSDLVEQICQDLEDAGISEFELENEEYFVQAENNKGYDYLGLWHKENFPACLNRVFFDVMDGISADLVKELMSAIPC